MNTDWKALFEAAEHARTQAYAPYSKFKVGVAVLTQDGDVVEGCNVENASYGLTVCAERNALAAVQVKGKKPLAIAIRVDSEKPTPPCGACRQVIAELAAPDTEIRSRTAKGLEERYTLRELLPHLFDKSFL
ncbi:MAG: cytidine deaminase [Myxococcaceae bacterium]